MTHTFDLCLFHLGSVKGNDSVNLWTTSELESFNNYLLMYAPKRNAFRRHGAYSKAAGRWSKKPTKEHKACLYIPSLTSDVINELTISKKVLSQKSEVLSHNPRKICSTIAPVSPPPASELQDNMFLD
ncbi:hypothetical protein ACF0H5_010042 [Mactra antiquata]